MPRVNHRAEVSQVLSRQQDLLFTVLLAELNALREHLDLPQRTRQDVRHAMREWLRSHPAQPPQGGA